MSSPTLRPRLFLSYGRADASDLARALTTHLTAAGFEVWRDVNRLAGGQPWDVQLREAIGRSAVLLAVLTPHTVRSASLADPRGEDGVCLDEIAAARFARPRVPILPILALPCAPPLNIERLHFLDFTHWQESEATWRQLLQSVLDAIARLLSGQPERKRELPLQSLLFDTYLQEKQQHFVGASGCSPNCRPGSRTPRARGRCSSWARRASARAR